eukprot:5160483-Pleurochrysis_carterae.AAC.3
MKYTFSRPIDGEVGHVGETHEMVARRLLRRKFRQSHINGRPEKLFKLVKRRWRAQCGRGSVQCGRRSLSGDWWRASRWECVCHPLQLVQGVRGCVRGRVREAVRWDGEGNVVGLMV